MKAASDGSKRKDKVKWVVSVIPTNGNELNMPNKAQRASALGKNKKHFVAKKKKKKIKKNMDYKGESKELERGIQWNY